MLKSGMLRCVFVPTYPLPEIVRAGSVLGSGFRRLVESPCHRRAVSSGEWGRAGRKKGIIGNRSSRSMSNNSETAVTVADEAGAATLKEKDEQQVGRQGVAGGEGLGEKKQRRNREKPETGDDGDPGFSRAEMHSLPLVGSVNYYERHVFLCCKDPESWPPNVEAAGFDRLPNHFAAALKARKNDLPKKTRLTICSEEHDGPNSSAGDVLMFPAMVRYKGLTHVDVDTFVQDALVSGKEWTGSKVESLSGSHIFVCAHGSRDRRCGTCGPALIKKLEEEIKHRGLESQIFVRACSHIGGHKYAGNLIVFSSTGTDPVSGHWYGYVSPEDVPLILDAHIGRGEIIDRLWRGQMGVDEADQKSAQQSRLDRVQEERNGCACSESSDQVAKDVNECSGSGCCQSSDPSLELDRKIPDHVVNAGSMALDGHLIFEDDDSSTEEERNEPRIPLWGPYYIPRPKWFASWEKEDTNAVLAVVGAAAAVAIAVHLCREAFSR